MKRTAVLSSFALVTPFAAANSAPPAPAGNTPAPAPAPAPAASANVGVVSDIDSDWTPPERKGGRGGGVSPYKAKLDALNVGQSIHVAGKKKSQLNSTMHTFNNNHRVYIKDSDGNPVTELKIGKNKAGEQTRKNVPIFTESKKFDHFEVDATDKRGPGVRILRVK